MDVITVIAVTGVTTVIVVTGVTIAMVVTDVLTVKVVTCKECNGCNRGIECND